MDAVAERQQAEPLEPLRRAVEAGHRLGEPAERAGREAAEDDARFPGFAQDLVDPVRPPDPEQADHAAAADVDQVLGEQVARAGPRAPARGGRARCGWPRSGRRRRRGRSGRCSGRRRRWPRAGSRPAAARPRSGRARSRRAAGSRTPSRSRRRRRRRSGGAPSSSVKWSTASRAGRRCTAVRSFRYRARPRVQAWPGRGLPRTRRRATAARRRGAACRGPGAGAP